jgi:putative ABC transport system substrate-binding protein
VARIGQRIPVRIELTDVPADGLISAGMTCTATLEKANALKSVGASGWRPFSSRLTELSRVNCPRTVGSKIGRRGFVASLAGIAVLPTIGHAYERPRKLRIGDFSVGARDVPYLVAFGQRLRELGYIEGENLTIEFLQIDRLDGFQEGAKELVRRNVDVIVASGPEESLKAAHAATQTIPIVMLAMDFDPVALGYVHSFARPEGNITGIAFEQTDLIVKRLELLKGILPKDRALTVLRDQFSAPQWGAVQKASESLGLDIADVEMGDRPYDYEQALAQVPIRYRGALFVPASPMFYYDRVRLAQFALQNRMLSTFAFREFVDAGGLFSYGPSLTGFTRRAADYVHMIAMGTRTSDLPIEQPTKFEIALNLKTVKALGINISQSPLLLADALVE